MISSSSPPSFLPPPSPRSAALGHWQGRASEARGGCGRAGGGGRGGAREGAPAGPAPPRRRSAGGRRRHCGPSIRGSVGLPGRPAPPCPPGAAPLHGPRRQREAAWGPLTRRREAAGPGHGGRNSLQPPEPESQPQPERHPLLSPERRVRGESVRPSAQGPEIPDPVPRSVPRTR